MTPPLSVRLAAATTGSRELDAEMAALFGTEWQDLPHGNRLFAPPPYTTSVDAVLAAIPDEWTAWSIRSRQRKTAFVAEICRMKDSEEEECVVGRGPTPALALCLALLRAIGAEG